MIYYPLKVWAMVDMVGEFHSLSVANQHLEKAYKNLGETMDKTSELWREVIEWSQRYIREEWR